MQTIIIQTITVFLFFIWLYKVITNKVEGKYKIIRTLGGRPVCGISGVTGKIVNPNGLIVPGENKGSYHFNWLWPFHIVDFYDFIWGEGRSSDMISGMDKKNILYGNIEKDSEVTYRRHERTMFLLDQHDYRFAINNLETGQKMKGEEKKQDTEHVPIQNVKVNMNLNSTIVMRNIFQARYQAGGKADWYNSILATITGTIGEVVIAMQYADLEAIRGEKLQDWPVKNTEPKKNEIIRDAEGNIQYEADGRTPKRYVPIYVDEAGNRLEKVTFIQRINYEVLVVKKLGVELKNITLLDYEIDEASRKYAEAIQENVIAGVKKDTSEKEAKAIENLLKPKRDLIEGVIEKSAKEIKGIKQTKDETKIAEAQAQSGLRVKVIGGNEGEYSSLLPNVTKLVETALGLELGKEITDDKEEGGDKNQQQQFQKKHWKNKKRGGNQ